MDTSLTSLFISSFISSTLFPGGSEVVLAYLSSESSHPGYVLLIVATMGNTLGGMTSWGVGWLIARKYSSETLLKPRQQAAVDRFKKYGSAVLLLSWLPVIGDPLCVAAGWLRIHWLLSVVLIATGKAARYAVVIYIFA